MSFTAIRIKVPQTCQIGRSFTRCYHKTVVEHGSDTRKAASVDVTAKSLDNISKNDKEQHLPMRVAEMRAHLREKYKLNASSSYAHEAQQSCKSEIVEDAPDLHNTSSLWSGTLVPATRYKKTVTAYSDDASEVTASSEVEFIHNLSRRNRENREALLNMSYGFVRLDRMNPASPDQYGDHAENMPYVEKHDEGINRRTSDVPRDDVVHTSVNMIHSHNKVQSAEQCEQKVATESATQFQPSIFDEQYFGNHIAAEQTAYASSDVSSKLKGNALQNSAVDTKNLFEQQYFNDAHDNSHSSSSSQGYGMSSINESVAEALSGSVVSKLPRKEAIVRDHTLEAKIAGSQNSLAPTQSRSKEQFKHNENTGFDKPASRAADAMSNNLAFVKKTTFDLQSQKPFDVSNKSRPRADHQQSSLAEHDEENIYVEPVTKQEMRQKTRPVADVENPKTAYDLAVKLRLEKKGKLSEDKSVKPQNLETKSGGEPILPRQSKWHGKVDSKGFRVLTEQTQDLQYLTEAELVTILNNSIIYEDDQIVVIDKPYGLPSHGGPGVHHSVGKLLEPLAQKVDKNLSTLHLVHRLDKETTGVMVLAKTEQVAEILLGMFRKRLVVKRYWVITKGVPNPTEGVIDIPMAEGTVDNKYRMTLRPIFDAQMRRLLNTGSGSGRLDAITNYKVLSSYGNAALVQCQPETGVKHQIRCHLAFGLNTPILGDHKYSHFSKIAPQRLYADILQHLGIRQAKVRHLPMHLHAKAVVLPEFREGRNLFLAARLPRHFVQNMKWLKLTAPEKVGED